MLRLDFDRRLMLQFRGSLVTSEAGLLAYRELDDVLGLTEMAGDVLADAGSGKNGRHALAGLFRQSVFGRLAGYEATPSACATIRLCAGLSAAKRRRGARLRRVKWGASRRNGSRRPRTSRPGLFDIDDRLKRLSDLGDQHEALRSAVDHPPMGGHRCGCL
jgi:hypothetical protein